MMMASNSYEKHPAYKALYDALIQSLFVDEDDMDKVAAADLSTQLKRKHDDQNEDPTTRSDQGKEKKRRIKDTQSSKKPSASKESSKGKTSPKTSKSGKSVTAEEPDEEHVHEVSMDAKENIVHDMGNADEQLDGEAAPKTDNAPKNNWFKQPPRPPTPDSERNKCRIIDDQQEQTWFNDLVSAEKDPLTFDDLMDTPINFSKFAKNRLKLDKITKADLVGPVYNLLKGTCQSSIKLEYNMEECYKDLSGRLDWTNPKGDICPYDLSKPLPLKGRPVKVGYNKDAGFGISHWGPKRQLFYRSQINKLSRHDVYSNLKILSVVSVTVDKKFGYGYLEEIMERRADRKLYTFKEGDFINLHLNDTEDMLLLVVQHKLFHLEGDIIVDLAVALRMFTRRIVIKKRVEDVQLGVERVVYEDLSKQKRLMRADELYKFSDRTLKSVRDTLHHMLLNFKLGYNKDMPRRKWSDTDKRRPGIRVKLIDEKLLERRIMQNLERLVGVRELEMDYRLMQRTV
ncbi:hypothetical protein Tco_0609284 [Tanacetum coccineum]